MPTNGSNSGDHVTSESKEKVPFVINASDNEISALRSEVDELSNDVHTAVEDLRTSISDIRSTVSELENPFNVLRVNEKDSDRYPPGVKSLILGKPDEKASEEKEATAPKPENVPPKIEQPAAVKNTIVCQQTTTDKPIRPSVYLDWVWKLLEDGLTAENIRDLANLCEITDYLPKQANEYIFLLARTAEKIRLIGFTKHHLLLFMYKAAAISKTQVEPDDMEALINLTENQLNNKKDE